MANTKQFTIANLVPNEMYAMQVRAVDNGDSSPWSNKHHFETIKDSTSGGPNGGVITAPVATTLISWVTNSAGFVAVWNSIDIMIGGKTTVITHYDLELTDSISGITYIWPYYTNTKPTVSVTIPLSMMRGFFGGAMPGNVTLRVRGVNSAGTVSDWSNSLTCSMGTPDPPTNAVVVEAVDSLSISWTAPVNKNYLDGYRVYTGATAGFTPNVNNKIYEGPSTTFSFTTTTYSLQYFKISSYNLAGTESTYLLCSGTPKSPFTIDVAAPGVPTGLSGNLSVAATLPRFAELSWTFNAATPGNEDVAGFVIAWHKVGDTNWKQSFVSPELRAISIELPLPYADYEFKIASYDKVGNYSAYSTLLSLSGSIPGAPAQVTGVASTASLDTFRITWTANTEADVVNGGVYNVDIATNSGFTTGLQSYTTGNTFIEIGGLLPATTYYYRVRAVDVGGTAGIYSATGNRTTPDYAPTKSDGAAPSSSPTPTLVAGIGYLTALWTRITNNDLVTYDVHISTTTGFTPTTNTLVTSTTATSTIIRTLPPAQSALAYGTTYYVKIIARDADGSAAASAQASSSPLQATNADVSDVSAGKLTAGSISAATITIAPGGSLTTSNGDVTITGTGITVGANSNISAAAMQAGTAFVDDLTISSNFTVGTSGVMKSANYAAGTTGWQLTNTAFDMRSGTVAAGTLVAGTITSGGIIIGANGAITVDSSGVIKSNNYAVNTTGWQISSTGIQMNDANSTIKADSIKTGSISSSTITLGTASTSGIIKSFNYNGTSTGWQISDTGLVIYTGTIQGAAVYTNQLASLSTDPNSPLPPIPGQSQGASFGINASGKAVFSGALIYGNTVLGNSSSHQVSSGNFISGTQGWLIRGDGYSEFAGMKIYGSAQVGGSLSSTSMDSTQGIGWVINGNGTATFYGGNMIIGSPASGSIWLVSAGGNGQVRFYLPGHTPGVSGTFHYMRPNGNNLEINGAFGGSVVIADNAWANNVGWIPNAVQLAINAVVYNNLYVNGYTRFDGSQDTAGAIYAVGGIRSSSHGNFPSIRDTNTGQGPVFDHLVHTTGGAIQVLVGNGGRLQVASSGRYKENIRAPKYTTKQLLSLQPRSFEYKDKEAWGSGTDHGFIAEEVHDLGLGDFLTYKKIDGVLVPDAFKYTSFVSSLQQVNQEQQARIEALEARLEAAGL